MDILDFVEIIIEKNKIEDYLLNINHPDGFTKARFFTRHGYNMDQPDVIRQMLLEHLSAFAPDKIIETDFGRKYILDGKVISPDNYSFQLRSVWIKRKKEKILRFVTAYPI